MIEGVELDDYGVYLDACDLEGACTGVNQFGDTTNMIGQVDQPSNYLPGNRRNSFDTNRAQESTKVDPDATILDMPVNPGFHPIHPTPLDRSDMDALRAFGAC